ncbi:MFS transporter [Limobrevibacterium gyesilva]|uniref:MFS transporter n=1 Tax=Limobrevibacterium gyesilva TaxID=2991712 RepID=A0AA42CJ58_9PROT|nr:MFS transporter [Limobrevibacterium gyesilva]MCW3476570.1 MFS transporter [Limobrevibacterium gyesilva]
MKLPNSLLAPPWVQALGATLLVQSTASFMGQCLPVVAPLLTASTGLAPERIGNLTSLTSFGTVLFLAFGSAFLARFGPVRMLQIGSGIAVAGMLIAASGWWPALVLAALLLGIGYGPTPPAGSRILAATAPPAHRTLIFSIKQAGAPAGGALAGLIVAPFAVRFGWPYALLLAVVAGILSAAAISPLRAMMDTERDATRPIHPRALFQRRNLLAPMAALRGDPLLASITALAVSFSLVQGTLFSFSVTYLTQRGLSLEQAGLAYACLQAAGVFARVFLGWFADRTGRPAHNLTAQAYVAAAAVWAFAFMPMDASLSLTAGIATLAGFFGASWNGIYLAEVARLSPPDQVADATSGSTLFTFLGYVAGPSLFALAVPWLGWQIPFAIAGAQLALMGVVQSYLLLRRRG